VSALRKFIGWNKAKSYAMAKRFPRLFASASYSKLLHSRIEHSLGEGVERVLEVGGIDRPLLEKGRGFEYVGIDIEEKDTCYGVYDRFLVQSVEDPIEGPFDLVISITLMEHVPDNEAAVRSIYGALKTGGETHHYIPSKWHPYAIALRMVGPKWQARLIPLLRPGSETETGYPAFFSYCTGSSMRKLLKEAGFEDVDVQHFYWATDYFSFFFPLFFLVNLFEQTNALLGLSWFASGFVISARKPAER
jgi:SAM-dependent methyltransferase